MDNLFAARSQMAFSLAFHIIFASIGIAMPFLMAASHGRYLKTRDEELLLLTKAWSKGVAIFFAVGAVSGTALSFELGLLWPGFMKHAGPIIGMPFSWEGTAFFLEAIAIGIFLYGWGRVPERIHWASGLVVGLAGVASGFFVICANSWMNNPVGFDWNNGSPVNIDPWAAMFNPGWFIQGMHMTVAAFEAVGFAVAGFHALLYLKSKRKLHLRAIRIALFFGAIAAIAQPLVGDRAAKMTAERQPLKLAAMEALFKTQRGAPLLIGGLPDLERERVDYAIQIPRLLSYLSYGSFDAEVKGLEAFDRSIWPPVIVVHLSFQLMVACGTALAILGVFALGAAWLRPRLIESRTFLTILVLAIPLGFIAIEAGWFVTEVGRQPWIIYNLLRTADSLTPRPAIVVTFVVYLALYALLAAVLSVLLLRQSRTLEHELAQREGK